MLATTEVHDFSTAARAILGLVQSRLHFDVSLVARRQGDHCMILDCLGGERIVQTGDVMPWSDTFCALMMAGEGPTIAPLVDEVPAYAALCERQGLPLKSVMSAPIFDGQGDLFGTLCGFSFSPQPTEVLADEPLVRLWADLLGLIVANELAVDQQAYRAARAERAAETDILTGLSNRRLWDRLLSIEEARCQHYGSPASILVIDLDDLKSINDEQGHAVGDAHLARVGACLAGVLPPGVRAARIGGDEFAVLATECDRTQGEDLASLVAAAFAKAGVSASMGLGVRSLDLDMIEAWRQADREMYEAKGKERRTWAPGRRTTDIGRSFLTDRLARLVTTSAHTGEQIDEVLFLTREHLDSDVAMVAEIRDGRWIVRYVSARDEGWEKGLERPVEETYCQRMITGRIPEVVPDTSMVTDRPALGWLSAPVGSYVGVPLALGGTEDAGTLCCFSAEPDLSLNHRDAAFLHLVARLLTDLIKREETLAERQRAAMRRVEKAQVPGAVKMAFQPIVELATGVPIGLEALARVPGLDDMAPSSLFDAADEAGVTVEMELFTANMAVAGLAATEGYLAVNFSATTLLDPGFVRFAAGLPLERLVVEISEHTKVEDYGAIDQVLAPLRAQGLRLAVDDTGAGFASFHHILQLRPDIIKLDISLVRDVATDELNQRLAAALAGVGQQIGAQVVAEGIEDEGAVVALRKLGVTYGQGYYLGRPEPLADGR